MITDPDVLIAVIAQMKTQFGTQIAELNDALACANVGIAQRDKLIADKDAEIKRLNLPSDPPLLKVVVDSGDNQSAA